MSDWHDIVWQYLLQELKHMERECNVEQPYTLKNLKGFVHLEIDGKTYVFDKGGYAGNTSAEIAHNMAKDMVENYLM